MSEVISVYTAKDAVEDDDFVLAPTGLTEEAGYQLPVTFTKTAWAEAITWDRAEGPPQDETGRLWDVLVVMRGAAKGAAAAPFNARPEFTVLRVANRTPAGNLSKSLIPTRLVLDVVMNAWNTDGELCLTVLLPGED